MPAIVTVFYAISAAFAAAAITLSIASTISRSRRDRDKSNYDDNITTGLALTAWVLTASCIMSTIVAVINHMAYVHVHGN